MPKADVRSALQALAKQDEKRSQTARLREILDEVEATLASGVKRADVLATLREHGFTLTLKSFESALHRLRKERAKEGARRIKASGEEANASSDSRKKKIPKIERARFVHDPTPDEDLLK